MKFLLMILAFCLAGCTTTFKARHAVTVERDTKSDFEKGLIEKAETLPVRDQDLTVDFISRYSKDGIDITERWWTEEVDGTRLAYTVNSEALRYYRSHSTALKLGKRSKNGIRMKESSFRYSASVQYFSNFKESELSFDDVYVVSLSLDWSQYCGPLCSASWSRTKKVIFNRSGNVLEVIEPIETECGLIMLISNNSNQTLHTTPAKRSALGLRVRASRYERRGYN